MIDLDFLKEWSMERYEDLPDFDIYIEQLLHIIDRQMEPFKDLDTYQPMTQSMINNYVKNKILTPPNRKKYNKNQLCVLIVISFLKSVFSINDIKKGVDLYLDDENYNTSYNKFCDFFEKSVKNIFFDNLDMDRGNRALFLACNSIAAKLYVDNHFEFRNKEKNNL